MWNTTTARPYFSNVALSKITPADVSRPRSKPCIIENHRRCYIHQDCSRFECCIFKTTTAVMNPESSKNVFFKTAAAVVDPDVSTIAVSKTKPRLWVQTVPKNCIFEDSGGGCGLRVFESDFQKRQALSWTHYFRKLPLQAATAVMNPRFSRAAIFLPKAPPVPFSIYNKSQPPLRYGNELTTRSMSESQWLQLCDCVA